MKDFTTHTFLMESSKPEDRADESNATTNNTKPAVSDACVVIAYGNKRDIIFCLCLSMSMIIIIGLSFTQRRKKCCLRRCSSRPGFLQPVDFFDEVSRRWAYATCFAIMTSDIVVLFLHKSDLVSLPTYQWMKRFEWASGLAPCLEVLIVCLLYYPMMACITHRRYIAANVLGLLYLIPWIALYSCIFYFCPMSRQKNYLNALVDKTRIAIYLGFYTVGFSYVLDLVENITRRRSSHREPILVAELPNSSEGILGYSILHHREYVANLAHTRKPEQINGTENAIKMKLRQLMKLVKYDTITGFRYSTRLLCCTTVAATTMIWIVIAISAWIEEEFQKYTGNCEKLANITFLHHFVETCKSNFSIVKILFHVSNTLAGLVVLIFMLNTLITYRRHWHQMLRGDHSWHMYGTTIDSPSSTMEYAFQYAGFQVAYAISGWAVLLIFLWIVLMVVTFVFILIPKEVLIAGLIYLLIILWKPVLLVIVVSVTQKLICRVVFLKHKVSPLAINNSVVVVILKLIYRFIFFKDKGLSLAINNRRLYNAAICYFLALNVIVGFFTFLKRILISLVFGILFLSRLDQPLIVRGFETFDPGYVAFVSMLLVDFYNNHPVVKVFVELMLQVRQQEQSSTWVYSEGSIQSEEKRRRSKLIRNRWWKTVTLANNPSLVLKVLEQRLKNERRNAGQTNQPPTSGRDDFNSNAMGRLLETMATSSCT